MRNEAGAKAYETLAVAKAEAEAGVITAHGEANAHLEYIRTRTGGDLEMYDRLRVRLITREIEG